MSLLLLFTPSVVTSVTASADYMLTKAELVVEVLGQLRVLAASEDPSVKDAAFVALAYDGKLDEWRRRGFVWWLNTGYVVREIPIEVFDTLVDLMTNELSNSFGVRKTIPLARKRSNETYLLRSLRGINAKPPSGESTTFSSY